MLTGCWWVAQAFVVWWNVGLLRVKDPLPQKLEPVFHLFNWTYPFVLAFIINFVPSETNTGGSAFANPLCGFNSLPEYLEWSIFIGVLIVFLAMVVFFLTFSTLRVLLTPYAQGNWAKAFGDRLPHQALIMTFCLVYVNVVVAVIAQLSYSNL